MKKTSPLLLTALLCIEDTRDNSDRTLANYSSRVQAVVDVSGPTDFTPCTILIVSPS
jgi:hypothetical protein